MKNMFKTLIMIIALSAIFNLNAAEPQVTSTAITSIDEDSEYDYQLLATDSDRQPITWQTKSDTQLPSWLSLNLSYEISTYAGSGVGGIENNSDPLAAKFNTLAGITADQSGNLYVSEFFSYQLRQIATDTSADTGAGAVTTIAGDGNNGDVDSTVALQAQFGNVRHIAIGKNGLIYIADDSNHKIRQFAPSSSEVSTLAGSGVAGYSDNLNPNLAEFSNPFSVAVDSNNHVYVSEKTRIRKIDGQTQAVTTIAGSGITGSDDNPNPLLATFSDIKALAVDSQYNIYLTDGHLIRKIDGSNQGVSTIAGSSDSGDIDDSNGLNARFNSPQSLALDSQGNLFIGDYANHKIRKLDAQTGAVSTLAGTGQIGSTDSTDPLSAAFNYPTAMFMSGENTLFVADWLNHKIRKITPTARLQGTPTNHDVGIHPVCLLLSDSTNDVEHCFEITVNNTNDAPSIIGTPATTIAEDSFYSFIPDASDVDIGDTLSFAISGRPVWASFDSTTGNLSGTPTNAHVGSSNNIIISVNDGIEQVSLTPFTITVTNTNDAPTISGIPATEIDENTPYLFTPDVSDVDIGDELSFSINHTPVWAEFNNVTGTISGTPTRTHLGISDPITITVSDSQASANLGPFTIEVLLVNDAPIVSGNSYDIDEDNSITFDIAVEDAQNDPLVLSISAPPANGQLTLDGLTATYTPKANYYGTDSFNIIANDGFEDSNPATFTINITDVDDESAATNDVIYLDYQDSNASYPLDVMANDNIDTQLQIVGAFSLDGEVTISNDELILVITNQSTPPETGKTITIDYVLLDGNGNYTHAQVTAVLRVSKMSRLASIHKPNKALSCIN